MQEQGIDVESEEGQQQFQQGVQKEMSLPGIQKFMNRNYKSNWEEWANRILEQSYHKYKLFEKEPEIIKHQLISDEAYLHIIIEDDDLDVEVWNPKEVGCIKTPHVKYTNQASMVGRQYLTTINQVISRYKNKLHPSILEKYNTQGGMATNLSDWKQSPDDNRSNLFQEKQLMFFRNVSNNSQLTLNTEVMVTEGYWITQRRMINLKAIYDGVYVEKNLDDNFEQTIKPVYDEEGTLIAGEELNYYYAPQVWKGSKLNFSKIGVPSSVFNEDEYLKESIYNTDNRKKSKKTRKEPTIEEDVKKGEFYIDVAPTPFQFTDSHNPWKPLIPVVGCKGFQPNMNINRPYSLVDKSKAYQVMFNAAMNQIDNFMKTEIGLFHLIDWKLIPRDSLNGTQKGDIVDWVMTASETGIGGVDSSPTNTGGGNVFQQPTVVNLLKNPQFQSRLELAAAFKSLLFETIGITPQRMGAVQERETATGVTQAVNNSYAQTEQLFMDHSNLMREFKEMLIDAEKFMESKKPISRIQFYNSDEENIMFELDTDNILLRNGFKNSYLVDHEYDIRWDYEGCIYLLFEPEKFDDIFEDFSDYMRKHKLFKDEYDLNGKVMFVMEIPEQYKDIFLQFKLGRYSKFNRNYVQQCIPMVKKGNISKAWKIFNQDLSLRREWEKELGYREGELEKWNEEVYPRPEPKDEIYRYNPEIKIDWE